MQTSGCSGYNVIYSQPCVATTVTVRLSLGLTSVAAFVTDAEAEKSATSKMGLPLKAGDCTSMGAGRGHTDGERVTYNNSRHLLVAGYK